MVVDGDVAVRRQVPGVELLPGPHLGIEGGVALVHADLVDRKDGDRCRSEPTTTRTNMRSCGRWLEVDRDDESVSEGAEEQEHVLLVSRRRWTGADGWSREVDEVGDPRPLRRLGWVSAAVLLSAIAVLVAHDWQHDLGDMTPDGLEWRQRVLDVRFWRPRPSRIATRVKAAKPPMSRAALAQLMVSTARSEAMLPVRAALP